MEESNEKIVMPVNSIILQNLLGILIRVGELLTDYWCEMKKAS
jgi:hypothetical protein